MLIIEVIDGKRGGVSVVLLKTFYINCDLNKLPSATSRFLASAICAATVSLGANDNRPTPLQLWRAVLSVLDTLQAPNDVSKAIAQEHCKHIIRTLEANTSS